MNKRNCFPALIFLTCLAVVLPGCQPRDVKQMNRAVALQKKGEHAQAIALMSELAVQKGISEYAVQYVQLQYCQFYGHPDRAGDKQIMDKDTALKVAESCAVFYKNFPNRTTEGLGPFEMGMIFKSLGLYAKAADMFLMAEAHKYYDPKYAAVNKKSKRNCGELYKQMMETYAGIPGEEGVKGVIAAENKMRDICKITVKLDLH